MPLVTSLNGKSNKHVQLSLEDIKTKSTGSKTIYEALQNLPKKEVVKISGTYSDYKLVISRS